MLRDLALEVGADMIVVDSLKDAAIGLSEDVVGAGYNSARQKALTAGIEVLELHHQVKRGADGGAPNTLSDVYGSTWLTGGAGSVILLSGKPGDTIVDFHHLKQPAEAVGPFKVIHDHEAGTSSVWKAADPVAMIQASRGRGITVRDLASALYDKSKPTANEIERARRKLLALDKIGAITSVDVPAAIGGKPSKLYHEAAAKDGAPGRNYMVAQQSRGNHTGPVPGSNHGPQKQSRREAKMPELRLTQPITSILQAVNHDPPPPYKEGWVDQLGEEEGH